MRLNSLHLVNFRQHADTRIEFDAGLTGIIGPNGAGKSTILEAIAWAIYGTPAARGTRETIRNLRAGARATVRVELDFDLAGHRYRVVRGLSSAELYLDGSTVPIANSISGVTDLVVRRLGMTRDEFFNTYFTGQKELSVMSAMGPTERARFLSHVLGYDRLRTAQRLARDRRSAIIAELNGLRQGMPDPAAVRQSLADAEHRLGDAGLRVRELAARSTAADQAVALLRPQWESAQAERERVQAVRGELRAAEQEALGLERDRERLERELAGIAEAKGARDALQREIAPLAALRQELAQLETLARSEDRRQALTESCRSMEEELVRLRERREKLQAAPQLEVEVGTQLTARREELAALEQVIESRRTDWVRDRQEAETRLHALRAQYAELKHQRDRLASTGETEPCPTCLRPLGDALPSVLELLDSQIETVFVDGNYYKRRVEQLQVTPDDLKLQEDRRRELVGECTALERRLMKVQLAAQELGQVSREIDVRQQRVVALRRDIDALPSGYDAVRHGEVRATVERLAPLEPQVSRLAAQLEREPSLLDERERVHEGVKRVQQRLVELKSASAHVVMTDEAFETLRAEFHRTSEEMRTAQLALVSSQGEESAARQEVERARRAMDELAQRQRVVDELQLERRLHDELDRAYSDLRTDLNFQLRPELSELASTFLAQLTDGRYAELELDDQYNVVVFEEGVPKPVISGGEEDLASLVLRLAISQMIAERAGQPFCLLVLDEIFGSLDEKRRTSVVELLRRLQDRFEQVILITHIEDVREGIDRVISVSYDEERGASVVEQPSQVELTLSTPAYGTAQVEEREGEQAVVGR